MRKFVLAFILIQICRFAFADIPDPRLFDSGTISVPETYGKADGRKIEIYWERLRSSSPTPTEAENFRMV